MLSPKSGLIAIISVSNEGSILWYFTEDLQNKWFHFCQL